MKSRFLFPIMIFIFVQLSSIATLVLWIVWYTSSKTRTIELAQKYGITQAYHTNVLWLLQGIFLLVPIIVGATLIFVFWTKSRALDTMRVNFISSVTHEFKTPLATIRMYLETFQIRKLDEEKRREFTELMLEDLDRLTLLISKVLNASRIEKDRAVYNFQETYVSDIIKNFISQNSQLLNGAELKINLDEDIICRLDDDSFNIVLRNLFENAVRYSKKPVLISLSLIRQKKHALLTIKDEGEGLRKNEHKRIFKMFYQGVNRSKGTGLGLYIVKNIVEKHKGKISALSCGLGKGTAFEISLPICSNPVRRIGYDPT